MSKQKKYRIRNWKDYNKKNDYHRRSLSETAMFGFKQLLGPSVAARTMDRQAREIGIKCSIINRMNQLSMPDGIMI